MSTKAKLELEADKSAKLNRRLIPKSEVSAFKILLSYILEHSETKTAAFKLIGLSWKQYSDIKVGHITVLNAKKITKAYKKLKESK